MSHWCTVLSTKHQLGSSSSPKINFPEEMHVKNNFLFRGLLKSLAHESTSTSDDDSDSNPSDSSICVDHGNFYPEPFRLYNDANSDSNAALAKNDAIVFNSSSQLPKSTPDIESFQVPIGPEISEKQIIDCFEDEEVFEYAYDGYQFQNLKLSNYPDPGKFEMFSCYPHFLKNSIKPNLTTHNQTKLSPTESKLSNIRTKFPTPTLVLKSEPDDIFPNPNNSFFREEVI